MLVCYSMHDDPNYYAMLYNNGFNGNGNSSSTRVEAKRVSILDSTLREGEQHPGVSFTVKQRIQIAWMLDYFGVDQIEISPVISKDHEQATKMIIKAGLKADILAHCRAIKQDIDVALACDAEWVATYMSVSDVQLRSKLKIGREEAFSRAMQVVDYIRAHGLKARFTLEDASRAEPEFLKSIAKAISNAGIERISIPDTVGIMLPRGMYNLVSMVKDSIDPRTKIDVHCHNDLGLALANALAGVDAGADQIHVTIDGIGERNGIPALAEVAVILTMLYKCRNDLRLDMLKDLSRLIEQYTGIKTPESKPIVGDSAFKHKAGTHLAAVLRDPRAYEIIDPRSVGNRRRIVFGELAGKNGAAFLLSILGLDTDFSRAERLAKGLKELRLGDVLEMYLDDSMEERIKNASVT
jgi:isopropylmalate/homocitrate/citramalate synthase